MSKYSSKPSVINRPIDDIYGRFKDLSVFQEYVEQLPADKLAQVGDVTFDTDSITLVNPQIGPLKFVVKERVEPTRVVFGAEGSPLPIELSLDLKATSPETTEAVTTIDVEIPMMLRPLIGGKIQEAADKFGQLLTNLSA